MCARGPRDSEEEGSADRSGSIPLRGNADKGLAIFVHRYGGIRIWRPERPTDSRFRRDELRIGEKAVGFKKGRGVGRAMCPSRRDVNACSLTDWSLQFFFNSGSFPVHAAKIFLPTLLFEAYCKDLLVSARIFWHAGVN
jgi:hypothetical protein